MRAPWMCLVRAASTSHAPCGSLQRHPHTAVEYGLMSTTTDKRTAFAYSGVAKKRGTVLEITAGRVDIGASISFLSQYPGEEEYLMPPLSCLEVSPQHLPLPPRTASSSDPARCMFSSLETLILPNPLRPPPYITCEPRSAGGGRSARRPHG